MAFKDGTTLEKPRSASDRRFSRGNGVIRIRGYRKSKVRRKVCAEAVKVSGGSVAHAVLDRSTYFAGDLGCKAGTPGNLYLFNAA